MIDVTSDYILEVNGDVIFCGMTWEPVLRARFPLNKVWSLRYKGREILIVDWSKGPRYKIIQDGFEDIIADTQSDSFLAIYNRLLQLQQKLNDTLDPLAIRVVYAN